MQKLFSTVRKVCYAEELYYTWTVLLILIINKTYTKYLNYIIFVLKRPNGWPSLFYNIFKRLIVIKVNVIVIMVNNVLSSPQCSTIWIENFSKVLTTEINMCGIKQYSRS